MSSLPRFVNWGDALTVVRTVEENDDIQTPQNSMWTDYTAPKTLSDVVGNSDAVARVDSWFAGPRTAPLIIHGPPGTGKTTLVRLCAAKHDVALFSSGADEPRTQAQLTGIINNATALRQTMFLDDADMFVFEPSGIACLSKCIRKPGGGSVIVCFNSIADPRLSPLINMKTSVRIAMKQIDAAALVTRAQRCARMVSRSLTYFDALVLASRSCGDARRLIIDMQVEAIDNVCPPQKRKRVRSPTLQHDNAIVVKPSFQDALSPHDATVAPLKCLEMAWGGWLKCVKTDMHVRRLSDLADSISDADLVIGTMMEIADLHETEDKDFSSVEAELQYSSIQRRLSLFREHNGCDDSDEQLLEMMKAKAVLLFITANVTWKSYLSRIQDTVMAHQIVQGFKNFVAEETTVIDIDCALSRDSLLSLKSVHRAKDITDVSFTDDPSQLFDTVLSSKKLRLSSGKAPMYNTLMKRLMLSPHREVAAGPASTPSAPYSGQHLTTEHIKVIFGNTAMHVAEILDRNGDGLVDKEEFVRIFEDIRSDAVNLKETLKDFEKISETLNRALTALSLIVTSFAALAILGVNLLQNSVVIVSVFVASSIVFGSSMQRFFEGIILVFASKPYEVGDRVLIDGMYLLVKNISILTTTSVGADGQYCILSNSQLKDAVIINAYRSGESSQRWSILVPCTVPPTYCEDLEAHLKNLNVVGVEGIDCWFDKCRADGVNDVIIVSARQRTNFQNVVTKARIGKQLAAGIKVFTADLPSPAHILATPGFGENV
ncbi:hypothetical protein JKP88DRAFT_251631 [Tribonema minus]|uniref:EF-hand domain-containing protein n=1 Tax=Tribonema minus TaxID=303371 RepID=A0A835ZM26_9STRA|nr:hypothetical protein JKP88DRAFT_251631 [Tribonema minus]